MRWPAPPAGPAAPDGSTPLISRPGWWPPSSAGLAAAPGQRLRVRDDARRAPWPGKDLPGEQLARDLAERARAEGVELTGPGGLPTGLAKTVLETALEAEMNGSATALLRVRGLRKDYGKGGGLVRAVDEVDLEVARGEALAVMGPSGCGKSTLLHLLGGLDRPSAGELWLNGRRIDRLSERVLADLRRREIGFVFQAFHLMDELTARENIELPALVAGRSPGQARRRALALLNQVGLADRADHLPSALSGGQRQRAAIARALVNEPLVVLADEPTGNLDSAAALDVLRLFENLRASGQTLVIVTHDDRVAATADRLVSMRDGALVEEMRLADGSGRNVADLIGLENCDG